MIRRASAALIAVALVVAAGDAGAAGDVATGRKLAETHCSRCHVVGDFNKFGGIGSTPSFNLILGMDDGLERFRTFFARRPHPAFVTVPGVKKPTDLPPYAMPFEVTPENIEDVAAFVETLKPKDVKAVPVTGAHGKRDGKPGSR